MDNNFLSLIKTRRSVRAYKSEFVPSEALDAVLEAGTYAPTGGGHQSPTIIAITDPKYRKEIAKLNAEVMGSNTDPYYGAPVVILVLADGSASTFVEDGSCVLENMMLAAHALGLGTVWVHREREIFDSESGKALLREWKLPETLRGVGAIALGYGTALVTGMMILGTLAVILFPAQILGLFTASEAMRSFGISAMRIMAASYLFCGLSTMISTYFQATEKVGSSMAIQLCRQMLFLVPALWCLDKLFHLNGIWLAFPVAETATLLVALVMMAWHRRKNIS